MLAFRGMREMNSFETEKDICSSLEKKRDLFRVYYSITKQMKETLENKESGDIDNFLHERQACVRKIERIDLSLDKAIKGDTKALPASEKLRELTDRYLTDIKEIMQKVDLADRELMALIEERRERIKEELLKMRKFRQAAQGYRKETGFSPRFLDAVR